MPINDKILDKVREKAKGDEKVMLAIGKLLTACDDGKQLKRVIKTIVEANNP